MAEHALALLDTSCVIAPPPDLAEIAEAAAISTLTVAELACGLHTADPVQAALREQRYRQVLSTSTRSRTRRPPLTGTAPSPPRFAGPAAIRVPAASICCSPRSRPTWVAVVLTRYPDDFLGLGDIVHVVAPG